MKRRVGRVGWVVVGLVAGLYVASSMGCASIERPDVYVTNITPTASTAFEQRLRVDLRLLNPNDFDLTIRGMDFKLDVNDVRLARGLSGEAFDVPALGEATCTVVTSTSVFDLLRQAIQFRDRPEIGYRMRGRLHLSNAPVRTVTFQSEELVADLADFAPGLVESMAPMEPAMTSPIMRMQ